MQARVIFSLGATNPAPPSTCRGTMVKAVAATPPVSNSRRERLPGGGVLVPPGLAGTESSVRIEKPQNVFRAGIAGEVRPANGILALWAWAGPYRAGPALSEKHPV